MDRVDLAFRQIHLDFHTSEHIAGIGERFDADEFASTLVQAHVNSVTCFARCHHGWIYFDTQRFPERRHPHLVRNLLAEQIEACHERGIRVPVYTTVQWDHYTAEEHPEWLVIDADGRQVGTPPYEPGFYRRLCINTPYRDLFREHVREILETLPVDGFFFDIVAPMDCSCRWCRAKMLSQGLEASDPQARAAFGLQSLNDWMHETSEFVWSIKPDCSIFYNAGHVGPERRAVTDAHSHWELESLPSGGWGYLHFPLTVRYARTLGLDCVSHTGKFHTSWGDFHSFKNQEALEYECFRMLALNCKCEIGDQLQPDGRLAPYVYDLVGSVYGQVEEVEPWCARARPLTDIALFSPEEWSHERVPASAAGAVRMLEEGGHQFDVVDTQSDLSSYKVVVLPDVITCSPGLAANLEAFVAGGGALIATHRSGLNPEESAFVLDCLGVTLEGEAPYSPDFILPEGEIGAGLPPTEHVMYLRGLEVAPVDGAEVLANVVVPYFNRTYRHFCSHRHTPSSGKIGYAGIVRKGRCIYFVHPLFTQYHKNAPRWCKTLFLNALNMLLPEPLVRHEGPSTLMVTFNEQPQEQRAVLHLLHYVPERRCQEIDIIEDVIPLYVVRVSVKPPRPVSRVVAVPDGEELAFEREGERVSFVVPKICGHQMVAIEYMC